MYGIFHYLQQVFQASVHTIMVQLLNDALWVAVSYSLVSQWLWQNIHDQTCYKFVITWRLYVHLILWKFDFKKISNVVRTLIHFHEESRLDEITYLLPIKNPSSYRLKYKSVFWKRSHFIQVFHLKHEFNYCHVSNKNKSMKYLCK